MKSKANQQLNNQDQTTWPQCPDVNARMVLPSKQSGAAQGFLSRAEGTELRKVYIKEKRCYTMHYKGKQDMFVNTLALQTEIEKATQSTPSSNASNQSSTSTSWWRFNKFSKREGITRDTDHDFHQGAFSASFVPKAEDYVLRRRNMQDPASMSARHLMGLR